MSKYNQLTEQLLSEGYTDTDYPDYVRLPGGCYGKGPLENLYGGFEYQPGYINKIPFRTGCGLFVKAENCISSMSYAGVEWCYENNNPVIRCPFWKNTCGKNDRRLWNLEKGILNFCVCHRDGRYSYEESIEKVRDKQDWEKKKLYEQCYKKRDGKICRSHMRYDEKKKQWNFLYDPMVCTKMCNIGFCALRNKNLDSKRGNVFYDLKVMTVRKDDTFFRGEPMVSIEKGRRLLEKPVSMDICREVVKMGTEHIRKNIWLNRFSSLHFYDRDLKIEILNLRAESRESRDLEQDLEDIRNGITVVHQSDQIQAAKKRKCEKRQERKEKRIERMEKQLRRCGYENLPAGEKYSANKILGKERIAELEAEYRNRPVQLELFNKTLAT